MLHCANSSFESLKFFLVLGCVRFWDKSMEWYFGQDWGQERERERDSYWLWFSFRARGRKVLVLKIIAGV